MAYIRAAQAGNFSNTATWVGGVVPGAGDYACTLTLRIILDVNTDAHLCCSRKDWNAAGGTDSAAYSGGFDTLTSGNLVLGGDIRFSPDSTTNRSTPATAVLNAQCISLTVNGGIKVIYDPTYTVTSNTHRGIYYTANDTILRTLIIGGVIEGYTFSNVSSSTASLWIDGFTNGSINITLNGVSQVATSSTTYPAMAINTGTQATAFLLTFNGTYTPGYNSTYSSGSIFRFNRTTIGVQNVVFTSTNHLNFNSYSNSHSLITVDNVDNCTFPSDYIIPTPDSVARPQLITISALYGTFSAPGNIIITDGSFANITGASSMAMVNIGNLTFNTTSTVSTKYAIYLAGTFNSITIGNIISSGTPTSSVSTALLRFNHATGSVVMGDITISANTQLQRALLECTNASANYPVTIGAIDTRSQPIRSNSAVFSVVYLTYQLSQAMTVNGNVYGSNVGTQQQGAGTIYLSNSAAGQEGLVINGNVIGGAMSAAISCSDTSTAPVRVNGEVLAGEMPIGRSTALPAIYGGSQRIRVTTLNYGPHGRSPVDGRVAFDAVATGLVTAIDHLEQSIIFGPSSRVVPDTSDVRSGIPVGDSAGSLVVPQASTVLSGVVYDDNTIGTLDLTSDITAIKIKTDQLRFTASSLLQVRTEELANNVGVDSDYNISFDELETLLADIKEKTDALTFTNGVNAKKVI